MLKKIRSYSTVRVLLKRSAGLLVVVFNISICGMVVSLKKLADFAVFFVVENVRLYKKLLW